MKKDYTLVIMFILVLSFLVIIFSITEHKRKKTQELERLEYLKDSLETEFYKKQLDSFPFEHSKIPDNGGN